MSNLDRVPNPPTASRGANRDRDRLAERALAAATDAAIAEAHRLAPIVAAAPTHLDSDVLIDVPFASMSEARYAAKRINDALRVDEWLDEVRVWVWNAAEHRRPPLSERGREIGYELRIEKAQRQTP